MSIPVIQAPMFLVSNPKMVTEACKAGIVGSFAALNQRNSEGLDAWLREIIEDLETWNITNPDLLAAPFGVNLIVHRTNSRLQEDLQAIIRHKVPIVITSLGAAENVVEAVHAYGGIVFHDVTNPRHAKKAAAAGVDGLILVCAGAGGHAGTLSPFAFLSEVREFYDKTILLAGCISDGRSVASARIMGADLAYIGSRFINVAESGASEIMKKLIIESNALDVVYTAEVSGVPGNFLRKSIIDAGLDPDNLQTKSKVEIGEMLTCEQDEKKAWKDIFSAGQGVGSVCDTPTTAELCARLKKEYDATVKAFLNEMVGDPR